MKKILVAYFSASGVTRERAKLLAETAKADLYAIRPLDPYTEEDLDWRNKKSRSSVEMQDTACRPPLAESALSLDSYDTVFLGFPIWWGREPSVVDTFIEAYALSGKRVIPFCTSGGGGFTHRAQLDALLPGVEDHRELTKATTADEVRSWLKNLG